MIKNKEKLLKSLIDQLNDDDFWPRKLGHFKVIMFVPDCNCHDDSAKKEYEFSLPIALDYLINDTYWDERGNWSEATEIILSTY